MKNRIRLCIVMVFMVLVLQGCGSMEAETSIKVEVSSSANSIQAELKNDSEDSYEWYYFIEYGNLVESRSKATQDVFSNTYAQKYIFTMNDTKQDTIYFVYCDKENLQTGIIYTYDVYFDEEGKIVLGECKESSLIYNETLMNKIENL